MALRSFRAKPVGWRHESHRHYLAAKGVSTKRYDASKVSKISRKVSGRNLMYGPRWQSHNPKYEANTAHSELAGIGAMLPGKSWGEFVRKRAAEKDRFRRIAGIKTRIPEEYAGAVTGKNVETDDEFRKRMFELGTGGTGVRLSVNRPGDPHYESNLKREAAEREAYLGLNERDKRRYDDLQGELVDYLESEANYRAESTGEPELLGFSDNERLRRLAKLERQLVSAKQKEAVKKQIGEETLSMEQGSLKHYRETMDPDDFKNWFGDDE